MFLKSLTISEGSKLIRTIPFHKGLNLIVDETHTPDLRESGNNVGKTTVLRLVDFCFAGEGTNIYRDPEFPDKTNLEIEEFLTQRNIIVEMVLKEDLDDSSSREVTVRRNFLPRASRILEVNGEKTAVKDLDMELKKLIFKFSGQKPTLRQIVAKNIRDEKNRLTNALKVLNQFARREDYEPLFLFWFGIHVDPEARRLKLLGERRAQQSFLDALKKRTTPSEIDQSLLVITETIGDLELKKSSFHLNETYEADLDALNEAKHRINQLSTLVAGLELRRNLIEQSRSDLEREKSNIDLSEIRMLYDEANALIPDLQTTFEETVAFHNRMVANKLEFITRELPELESHLAQARSGIAESLAAEKKLTERLRKFGVVEELQRLVGELSMMYQQKGALEEQQRLWQSAQERLAEIEAELEEVSAGTERKDRELQQRITEFNKYFSRMSHRLYGEHFVLSHDWGDRGLELKIGSVTGNPGTGKKKGVIAAFDLAYIQFAEAEDIECLHFVMQDQIENVHENQIMKLVTEIIAEVDCQYILPVLRDKLPPNFDTESFVAVSLSQDDKLFHV